MIPFEYLTPGTLAEAVAMLVLDDPDVRPVGGGTAIMLMMKAGVLRPTQLISLRHVEPTYRGISVNEKGELRIGGMATLASLERSALVQKGWPVLTRTFRTLSNIRVRNVATIGGNLAHSDPHMDMPPVLAALGGRVIATGPQGSRQIAVEDLCTGYYETLLARNELISEVIVPPMQDSRAVYFKVTTRAAHDWPALGVAVSLRLEDKLIRDVNLIVGAATDRPTRLSEAAKQLNGCEINDITLKRAGEAAMNELSIVSDQHGTAAYKKHLLGVYLGRAVRAAISQ